MKKQEIRKKRRRQREKPTNRQKPRLHFPSEGLHIDQNRVKKSLLLMLQIGAACLLAYSLVLFYGQRVSNAGDSMSPILKNGDVVLVDRLVYNAVKPKRGDIVVFKPGGNQNAHYLIKQVCTEGIHVSDIRSAGVAAEPVELGANEYFVIGDNHEGSDDSRTADVGTVKRKDIFGKAWFVVSGDHFGRIKE